MSDRLALANVIEDPGIERGKARRVASVIFDAIHNNVARKVDVLASETALRADIQALRHDMQSSDARLDARITGVRADLALIEHRLLTRLGGHRRAALLAAAWLSGRRGAGTTNGPATRGSCACPARRGDCLMHPAREIEEARFISIAAVAPILPHAFEFRCLAGCQPTQDAVAQGVGCVVTYHQHVPQFACFTIRHRHQEKEPPPKMEKRRPRLSLDRPAATTGAAQPSTPGDAERDRAVTAIVTTASRKRVKLLHAEKRSAQRDDDPAAAARMRAWLERAKWGHGPS